MQGETDPFAYIGVIVEPFLNKMTETPESLIEILMNPDISVHAKLIVLNCIAKNCGETPNIRLVDTFYAWSDITNINATPLDATKTIVCIEYKDSTKSCFLVSITNRRFFVSPVTNVENAIRAIKSAKSVQVSKQDVVRKLFGEDL